MSYQARHDFVDGASILGAQMATCAHCGTLRVTEPSKHPEPRYVLPRVRDVALRDTDVMPACLSAEASAPKGARERVTSLNRARAREQAVRSAMHAAPAEEREAERDPVPMLTHFPWYADMQRSR